MRSVIFNVAAAYGGCYVAAIAYHASFDRRTHSEIGIRITIGGRSGNVF